MNYMRCIAVCLAMGVGIGMCVKPSNAAVTFASIPVDNSLGGSALDGYVTTDVNISFDGQYTGAQALIELTGSGPLIYQDPFGSAVPPNPAFIGVFPSLAFDTFVAQGSAFSNGPHGLPSVGGGAVDLGGAATATFSSTLINQAWNPPGGTTIVDQFNFLIGRFTLSSNAYGTAKFLASAGGTPFAWELAVVNGHIQIVESSLIVNDILTTAGLNEVISTTMTIASSAGDVSWGNLTDFSYAPGFGAPPEAPGIDKQPVWDPLTQSFVWDTSGSSRGTYSWKVLATDQFGSEEGMITVEVPFVPEPASLYLFGLAIAGTTGCSRRR